ncbi:Kelch repeat-containing protein [Aquimarina rhabdastrellae]
MLKRCLIITSVCGLLFSACSSDDIIVNGATDGIINTDNTNNEDFEELNLSVGLNQSNLPTRKGFEMIEFDGKYWFFGGEEPSITRNSTYYNDIWNSTDGINWNKVVDNAAWQERSNFNLLEFDNKLWIVGGENENNGADVLNDVWNSTDGVTWNQVTQHGPWETRYAMSVNVHDNKLYLIGGHTLTTWHLYQDIWESSNGVDWVKVGSITDELLGTEQTRQGINEHHIIKFKDEYFLFAGQLATIFTPLTRVLKSRDMINWEVVTENTPWAAWKEFGYNHFSNLRPFVYKGNLIMVVERGIEISGNSPNPLDNIIPGAQFVFNSTDGGVTWEEAFELEKIPSATGTGNPLAVDSYMTNPRSLLINGEVFLYGSLTSGFLPTMRYFKLTNN